MSFFPRFTVESRRAIYFAVVHATHRGARDISTADLLVGLTWETVSDDPRLGFLKQRALEIRELLGFSLLPFTAIPYTADRTIPLQPDSKKVIAQAIQEADIHRQWWVDTDHLLMGVLGLTDHTSLTLQGIGVTLSAIRDASRQFWTTRPPRPVPLRSRLKVAFSNWLPK